MLQSSIHVCNLLLLESKRCGFFISLQRWLTSEKTSALVPELSRTWMKQGAALIGKVKCVLSLKDKSAQK